MIFEELKKIISETLSCGEDVIELDSSFSDDLGADSLDAVELCMNIEEELDITIPEEKISEFKTVRDIVEFIESVK